MNVWHFVGHVLWCKWYIILLSSHLWRLATLIPFTLTLTRTYKASVNVLCHNQIRKLITPQWAQSAGSNSQARYPFGQKCMVFSLCQQPKIITAFEPKPKRHCSLVIQLISNHKVSRWTNICHILLWSTFPDNTNLALADRRHTLGKSHPGCVY